MTAPVIALHFKDGASFTSFNAPIQTMTIDRGRSRQFDRFRSGSATINFFNADRKLDPLNTASAYSGKVVPRVQFRVLADSIPIYTGFVTDWDLEYDIARQDTAVAKCSDALTVLSNFVFTSDTSYDEGTCADRISDVLSTFSYSGPTDLGISNANLANDIASDNSQAMDYLFRVSASDNGNLFIAADGDVSFVGRYGRKPISELTFADDGSGIGYSALTNQYGDELLYNRVSVSSEFAGVVTLSNTTSISAYGLSVLDINNLLNANTPDLTDLAADYLAKYGDPVVRFTGLSVELAGLSSSDVEDVLNLDLADQVSVKRSFASGSPSSVTQTLIVTGIRHRIVPGSHVIEFSFEPSPYKTAFRLDDATDGILNTSMLG